MRVTQVRPPRARNCFRVKAWGAPIVLVTLLCPFVAPVLLFEQIDWNQLLEMAWTWPLVLAVSAGMLAASIFLVHRMVWPAAHTPVCIKIAEDRISLWRLIGRLAISRSEVGRVWVEVEDLRRRRYPERVNVIYIHLKGAPTPISIHEYIYSCKDAELAEAITRWYEGGQTLAGREQSESPQTQATRTGFKTGPRPEFSGRDDE